MAKEIIKRKGNKMGKEPHAGARKRTMAAVLVAQGGKGSFLQSSTHVDWSANPATVSHQ